MKKLLIILTALACTLGFISCGSKNSLEDYTVYMPATASAWEQKVAHELVDSIDDMYGIELELIISEDNRTKKEILIGKDCLAEDVRASYDYESMSYNGYCIDTVGESYLLTAATETGLREAVKYFVQNAITEDGELPKSLQHTSSSVNLVQADTDKVLNVDMSENLGIDVYKVPEIAPAGYRYGPSIIVNDDGSMDMWLAGGGSGLEQWDWIMYMHSKDGKNWSEEKCVLQPTPNSLDHYSCCDPGVIYLNGYYYLGYTSTLNANQCDNSLYVARSQNPDGPFEKWNGTGWGGVDPKPLVYFSEDQALWGIGEVSFVELDGLLYIYYTEKGSLGNVTRVATADASDENWPLTLKHKGIAIQDHSHDSIDVKYMEEYGKFIAVAADERLSEDSYLIFLESNDGYSFEPVDACKENVFYYCHNPGISGSANGHIKKGDKIYVSYAYGEGWGMWNTRLQEISVSLADSCDFDEINGMAHRADITRDTRDVNLLETAGISSLDKCVLRVPLNQMYLPLTLAKCNVYRMDWKNLNDYSRQVSLYGYDDSVVAPVESGNLMLKLLSVGETMVTVEYQGHLTYIYVIVYDNSTDKDEVVSVEPVAYDTLNINAGGNYQAQLKSIVTYGDGRWEMVWSQNEHGISYEYDSDALEINENSYIFPKKEGSHKITIKAGDVSGTLTVNVEGTDYAEIDFTEGDTAMLRQLNNCEATPTDKGLVLRATTAEDPFMVIDYTDSFLNAADYEELIIRYMIPTDNKKGSYTAQLFFRCNDALYTEDASLRYDLKKDGKWHELTVSLDDKAFWTGDVTEIRLDFFDVCEKDDEIVIESVKLK